MAMLWLWTFAALADPPTRDALAAALAPGPAEWSVALSEAEARASEAEVVGRAASRLQNAWGERLTQQPKPCATDDGLAARVLAFGESWRDAAQRARLAGEQVSALRTAPTVAPLVDPQGAARADAVGRRIEVQQKAFLESRAWFQQIGRPAMAGCALSPLSAAPGLPAAMPWLEDPERAAIIGVGGGLICPVGLPADGHVIVAPRAVCVGGADCACTPVPVFPGAVVSAP